MTSTPAPGIPGTNLLNLTFASVNAHGDIGISAQISGTGIDFSNDAVIYLLENGSASPRILMRENEIAPETDGARFSLGGFPELTDSGYYSFRTMLQDTDVTGANNLVIWQGTSTGLHPVARTGDAVAAIGGDTTFSSIPGNQFPISETGAIAFTSQLSGTSVGRNNQAAFVGTPGHVDLIARVGQPAPDIAQDGVLFHAMRQLLISPEDELALVATLEFETNAIPNPTGIWTGSAGYLRLFLRDGDPAPNLPGVTFGTIERLGGVTISGALSVEATLAGEGVTTANDSSIWVGTRTSLQLVARGGQRAPGTPAGVVFNRFDDATQLSVTPVMNENGLIAFVGTLSGPNVTSENDAGLWVQDGDGNLRLVVREGDLLPGPQGMAAVTSISLDPIGAYSRSGELVFTARLAGPLVSGLYRTTIPQTRSPIPTVTVLGRRHFVTSHAKFTLRGSSTNTARVEVKLPHHDFRTASGTSPWRFVTHLRPGKNILLVRAVSETDTASPATRIQITRRQACRTGRAP